MSRIFKDFHDAINEIKRDLSELSVELNSGRWQGKDVSHDLGYKTKELTNYLYTVTTPDLNHLSPTQPWADKEFNERILGPYNPGWAWKERKEVWSDLRDDNGKFSYTYSERIASQRDEFLRVLLDFPYSRQLFLSIWDRQKDPFVMENRRVPCSLGYYFQFREDRLNITYLQRSCDFITHFENDVYLAMKLLNYLAQQANLRPGHFSHWIGSLHVFAKDVKGIF